MYFEIVGEIIDVQVVASGHGVRIRHLLREVYGDGRWRKLKGKAHVRLADGRVRMAEVHWYEAHGVGRRRLKIKRLLE